MHVPSALAALPQWIVWRSEDGRKVPYDPRSGRKAKSNDPKTWATLAEAQAVAEQYAGIGFMFAAGGGICGADFDGCIDAEGKVADWATDALSLLPTYAEISPSGTGVKAFCLGELPGGKGKKHDMPGAHCGVEVYGAGRYFAFTGQQFGDQEEVVDCQAGIDELFRRYWPEKQPTQPVPQVTNYVPHVGPTPVEERAARYLDKLPPAISGASGHNQTFKAACVLVLGFGLPIERAFPLLAAWNQNCQPPWSDSDLWHKLGDADKRTGERGWLLRGNRYEGPDVDLSALLASVGPEQPAEEQPKYEPFESLRMPAELLQPGGLIQEILDLSMSSFRYRQPELSLAAALALMATITGRKVQDEGGARTNLYVLGIAASGAGKEGGREVNKSILCESGAQEMMGPESLNSSAGLVVAVRDNPAILLQIDEIGRLLATTNGARAAPHLSNIVSELLKMYSASRGWWRPSAYADPKKNPLIYCPHGVVYGTATPDTFWPSMTVEALGEGFLGRCLIFESRTRYPMPQAHKRFEKATDSIIEQVKTWLAYVPGSGNLASQNPQAAVIAADDAAAARLRKHEWEIREKQQTEDGRSAAVWSRAAEKTFKLALLFACSRGSRDLAEGRLPTITKRDADLAVMACNWTTRSLIQRAADYIAHNEIEASVKRLLRAIPSGGCTMSELTRRTQWMRSRERQDALATLCEAGAIVFEQKTTSGRPVTVVRKSSNPI